MATFEPFIDFASSLGMVVVIYFGGRLAFQQTLPIQDLVTIFLYLELFYQPRSQSSATAWESVQEALAGGDRVAELLDEEPEVAETTGRSRCPGRARGELAFRDVSFRYSQGEAVLEHIDLTIPGQLHRTRWWGRPAFLDDAQAGLIPRFYDVCDGAIVLDGHDGGG